MTKAILAILSLAIATTASANLNGDGYYRLQNNKTGRYAYILDDKGELNFQSTSAELGAIQLWKGYDKTISDPSTVIYVTDLNGKGQEYDLQAQGTGVKAIINYPVSIRCNDATKGLYTVFGRSSGISKYIGDATTGTSERGALTSDGNGEYHRWLFHPMTSGSDESNYFGIAPEFQAGKEFYTSFYAAFPFSFDSPGMTAYTVSSISDGTAYIKEIEGTIPPATPVIIKCSTAAPSTNKLYIGGSSQPIAGNMLKGIYFMNTSLLHKNLTTNDKSTMRVLGKLADGSLGFVTCPDQYLPRNKAYLVVPAGTPAELKIDLVSNSGISSVGVDAPAVKITVDGLTLTVSGAASADIYTVTGQQVAHAAADQATSSPLGSTFTITLPSQGLYIVKTPASIHKILAR